MPIVIPHQTHPLADGRQSENALRVRRGVLRLFTEMGMATLPEIPLASGRRADLVALTRKGEIWIVEIKSSLEDWRADSKWPIYRNHCDRLYFATHPSVPQEIFPTDCGFILSDGYGAEVLRDAPEHKLPAATRKAMTLRVAHIGAARLMRAELAGFNFSEDDTAL